MSKISSFYLYINKRIDFVEKIIAVAIISSIVLIVFAGTVARYLFASPFYGADRLATYLMIWLGFLGFQIAISKMRHIEIEFLKSRLKGNGKYVVNIISDLITSIFCFIISYISYSYLLESYEFGDSDIVLGVPLWIIIFIIPFSFFVSGFRSLFNIFLWIDVMKGKLVESDFMKKEII